MTLWLSEFRVGDVDCLSLGDIEETSAVISFLKGEVQYVVPTTIYNTAPLRGVFAELSVDYSTGYYLTCINTYLYGDGLDTSFSSPPDDMSTWDVPYKGDENYTFAITDVPFADLMADNTRIDTASIKAYGVRFVVKEPDPDPDPEPPTYPPANIWTGGRTFITIRDNETLVEIAKAYDLTNTKIHQQINDKYTLDFNILPYENVWRIGYPNLLEIDDDYFQVRRVTKNRGESLDMSISCEHVSYQMNMYNTEGIETSYTGTPYEILTHLLFGLRFIPGLVESSEVTEFKTSTVGMRSRIIEFANQIGAEVKFYKFEVSLLLRRGGDRGLTIEVGENLLNMTEITETQVDGEIVKSYEVDVIDLNKVVDENGAPLRNVEIHLGDTVNLIDVQFGIDIDLHIVSTEYDPFSKALPTVEIGEPIKNLFNQTDTVKKKSNNYWLSEFRVGDVDCLALEGIQMETSDVSSIVAEIEYESPTQYTGLFLTLKEAYVDSIITVTAYVDGESQEIPWNESKELFESLTLPNTGYATISEMVVTVNNGAESQYFGVKFVSESQSTAAKFRNIRTEPYSTYYDEESGNYTSGMAFSHKDFDSVSSGEIIGVVNGEQLTGLIYVHLEGFTGGIIKFKVVIKNVGNYYGEAEESIDTDVYLPSGTFTVPLHYHFYPYYSDSFSIHPELSLDGTATDVQFLEGSLWGVINYIQGVTG